MREGIYRRKTKQVGAKRLESATFLKKFNFLWWDQGKVKE